MTAAHPTIVVIGSANVDLTVKVERLPLVGETVSGGDFRLSLGGKGANQALAAQRAGAPVTLIAKLGRDPNGELLHQRLCAAGLRADGLLRDAETPSGVALIMVDSQGRNLIAVAPGSNQRLTVPEVESLRSLAFTGRILLTQLETPLETVEYALRQGRAGGMLTILNPAPGRPLTSALLALPDLITPNETEASLLTGIEITDLDSARQAGEHLLGLGCQTVIITLGANGALLLRQGAVQHFPAFSVTPVDSTGAGDAFNGVLAVALLEGLPLERAILWANAAGALSVTVRGAQESLPARETIETLLQTFAPSPRYSPRGA